MSDDAIPAATLVLFRDAGGDPAEHLFVERAATMAFAAGAIVFPGGRVDAGDRRLAETFPDLDPDDAAARVAAIRETIEEAGVAVGIDPRPDTSQIAALREGLLQGVVFADLLGAHRLSLDLSPLVPFARWRPNFRETRAFDTRFYLAEAGGGAASVDATENVRLFWATAQFVLDEAAAGRVKIIFPTRRNLERLAALGDFASARAQAAQIAPETISPWVEDRGGAPHLCIPDGRGYPVTAEAMASVRRG